MDAYGTEVERVMKRLFDSLAKDSATRVVAVSGWRSMTSVVITRPSGEPCYVIPAIATGAGNARLCATPSGGFFVLPLPAQHVVCPCPRHSPPPSRAVPAPT